MTFVRLIKGIRGPLALAAACTIPCIAASAPASAAVVYDEATSPDLSDDGLTPTPLVFGVGSNEVRGATGHDSTGAIDRDYFTFTIGANQTLTAINILTGTETIGASFIGLQSGNQVTLPFFPANNSAAGLLGWYHYTSADIGTDILDNMSIAANGSSGFTRPLGAGTYSIWVQEISPGGAIPYRFEFVVGNVPEPSTWATMLLGFGLIGGALRLRRRRGALLTT